MLSSVTRNCPSTIQPHVLSTEVDKISHWAKHQSLCWWCDDFCYALCCWSTPSRNTLQENHSVQLRHVIECTWVHVREVRSESHSFYTNELLLLSLMSSDEKLLSLASFWRRQNLCDRQRAFACFCRTLCDKKQRLGLNSLYWSGATGFPYKHKL